MKKSFLTALALAATVAFSAPVMANAATTTTPAKPAVHHTMKKKVAHKKVAHKKHKKVAKKASAMKAAPKKAAK